MLNLAEIQVAIRYQVLLSDEKTSYNLFCEEVEGAFSMLFSQIANGREKVNIEKCHKLVKEILADGGV